MSRDGGTSASEAGERKSPPPSAVRLIALIGFMAAGKSTVGAMLAQALGWTFIDVDLEIERDTGCAVADLFRERGEPAFRAIEADLTATLFERDHAVLALGGGWAVQPGAFGSVPPGVRTVWLRVSAAEAVRRAAADPGSRPLLAGLDGRETSVRRMLEQREAFYARADHVVDVDGRPPGEIVTAILDILRPD